eukprot:5151696-Alexandrium_andersonii.AAC.1
MCSRASRDSHFLAVLEAGPSGAVPGAEPIGLLRFLAGQRGSSALPRLSAASLALASRERGMPTGSRSPQRAADSTPRSWRPAWP